MDTKLSAAARAHSEDMLANNYFSHANQSGCSLACRLRNAGYDYSAAGENIWRMSGTIPGAEATATRIFNSWMNSSGHRTTMLGTTYTETGIGIASASGKVYATALFARPF